MNKSQKLVTVVATAGALTICAGIAYAAFNATGKSVGAGQASAGNTVTKQALVVTTNAPAGLYPTMGLLPNTDVPGNVTFSVTNPNPYAVTLTSADVTGVSSTCGAVLGDFTFGTASIPAATAKAARNNGTAAAGNIAITSVANSLADACANSPITFEVTVGGASS